MNSPCKKSSRNSHGTRTGLQGFKKVVNNAFSWIANFLIFFAIQNYCPKYAKVSNKKLPHKNLYFCF